MKKIISVILFTVFIFSLTLSAQASIILNNADITLTSDISGLSEKNSDKLVMINSEHLTLYDISISDYAGDMYFDKMKAGHTYFIDYSFVPLNGYSIPDDFDDFSLTVSCTENTDVLWSGIGTVNKYEQPPYNILMVKTKVVVDGNFIQRIVGMISDLILKMKAWSLY